MNSLHHEADLAVLIGRFQPFHRGHAALLQRALRTAPKVVVVLGSSFHARNSKNPFTWKERELMICSTLTTDEQERVSFIAVRDYYDDKRWSATIQAKVQRSAPEAHSIALIGHFKDASSYYLHRFPQWKLITADKES
ncbi:MAG: adenylyltransferase/cytidyltransferase family protein, partial [Burkholderiales bacterium]|nr:adenylyltransferase/cytidyltransferase family protein [Burkholderiales bacterium]